MEFKAIRIKHESSPGQEQDISQEQDIISTLPDGVVGHIISFLPLKQAIRMSWLSSRWRNIYTRLPKLTFHYNAFRKPRSEVLAFMEFVDRVITSHIGFVDKFVINFNQERLIDHSDSDRVDRWILYALDNKVRELDIRIGFGRSLARSSFVNVPMPIEIFTCKTLEALTLRGNRILQLPPNYICCLPNVKSLHLSIRVSDEGSFRRLVSSCTALEELVLEQNFHKGGRRFNVFNPTLKRLTISYIDGANYEFRIDAPNLVYSKCCCHVREYPGVNNDHNYSTAINLFKGIAHVQSLHLSDIFAKALLQGNGTIPELPKLTYLTLDSFAGWERILPDVLKYFPYLKTLHLKVDLLHSRNINNIRLPSSFWSNLKRLEISSFEDKDHNDERQIVAYFLKNAQFLEHFTVHTSSTAMTAEKRLKFSEGVLKLPKISKNCKILVVSD